MARRGISGKLRKTLSETFGIARLRPGQQEVIEHVLAGRHTLAIMPTGAGKSLCYQLPALHLPGTTVVVSPLISLMKDQTDKLVEAGVEAAQVNSSLSRRDEAAALAGIRAERSEIVFATPERLADREFLSVLSANDIDMVVIDEAHCISQWGHDFRPAYLGLGEAIRTLGEPPVLALTATATEAVIADIEHQLGLPALQVVNTGVYRDNLDYQVVHVVSEAEKLDRLARLVEETQGSGIVYCATVKSAAEVQAALGAALYHGRLPAAERRASQDRFMSGEARVMVATNAFGMGIDKPDIRFVIHYQMPGSLEAYYQESGRAGRDGERARCVLLYDVADRRVQQFFLARRYPGAEEMTMVWNALRQPPPEGTPGPSLEELAQRLPKLSERKLQVALKLLKDAALLREDDEGRLRPRGEAGEARLAELAAGYAERGERDREKLERMVFYAQSGLCRWKVLLEYFGEETVWAHCGHCDNCREPPERSLSPVKPAAATPPPTAEPGLRPGDPVTLPAHGEGQVAAIAGERVDVVFPDGKTRSFLRGYVQPLAGAQRD